MMHRVTLTIKSKSMEVIAKVLTIHLLGPKWGFQHLRAKRMSLELGVSVVVNRQKSGQRGIEPSHISRTVRAD